MNLKRLLCLVCLYVAIANIFNLSVIFADGGDQEILKDSWKSADGDKIEKVYTISSMTWSTLAKVFQVVAFAGVVFTGVRYMFASSSDRADIKKSSIMLVIGMILLFGASAVVNIIYEITKQAL